MPYQVNCPSCGQPHRLTDEHVGISVECVKCGRPFKYDAPIKEARAKAKAAKRASQAEADKLLARAAAARKERKREQSERRRLQRLVTLLKFRRTLIRRWKVTLPAAIILLAACGTWVFYATRDPALVQAARAEEDSQSALEAAQRFVADRLKSPAGAKWPEPDDDRTAVHRSDTGATVVSWVDAPNPYGVLLRMPFVALIEPATDGDWKPISIYLGEDEVAEYTGYMQGFAMLALADHLRWPHEKRTWLKACDMAREGYTYTDGSSIPQDADHLNRATLGLVVIQKQNTGLLTIQWRLARKSLTDEKPRSVLLTENKFRDYSTELLDACQAEFQRRAPMGIEETTRVTLLLDAADTIHSIDVNNRNYDDPADHGDFAVKSRGWIGKDETFSQYKLVLEQKIGDYLIEVDLHDRMIDLKDGQWSGIVVWFTYFGEDEPPLRDSSQPV